MFSLIGAVPWGVASTLMLVLGSMVSAAEVLARDGAEPELGTVSVQIDNDLLAGTGHDLDYTGGVAVAWTGLRARDSWLSLDPVLRSIDGWLGVRASRSAPTLRHARQLGLMAFTPEDIASSNPLPEERPYASLFFTANGRTLVADDSRSAWTSSLTVGVLGLSMVADVHEAVHSVVGSPLPRGYHHQISAGGEPTLRYALARQRLLVADPSGRLEIKTTLEGSVGYLTEASAAISLRFGRTVSPWWGFTPELTSYLSATAPSEIAPRGVAEGYFFAGARVRARAWNAFLQGQFRDSAVTVESDDVAKLIADAWVGYALQLLEGTQVSYTVRYQTAEILDGPAARDTVWASLQLTHVF